MTEQDDSAALLETLFAGNLFLIPLDDEARWYRYHHLFSDLLVDLVAQLLGDDRAALHRRASRWYATASGDPAQRVDEREACASAAIDHALAAEDYGEAVRLIETHATKMLALWHMKAVRRWIQALPPEWSRKSPRTNLAFAWTHLMHMDQPQAKPHLERLAAHFADPDAAKEDPALYAQWLALQAMLRNAVGQPTEALALAHQALGIVPAHEDYARCQVLLEVASAHQQMGDSAAAREAYEQVIQQGQASGNPVFELLAIAALSLIAVERGELVAAFEMTSRGIARMEAADLLPPISTALYGEMGEVCYQWHQLDEAQRYFRRATEVSALSGFSDAEIYHAVILSRLHQVEGDLTAAAREIQRAVDLMRVEAPAAVRDEVTAQRIRVYLAQGQVTRAEHLLNEAILTTLHENRISGLMSLHLMMVLMGPLTLIPSLALYVALKRVNESYALIALVLGLTGIVLCFVDRPLVEMVALSDQYAAATTDAARQQVLAAGEAFHVMFNGTAWVLWNFFLSFSYLIDEVLMIRCSGFRKSTAYLGLALSVSGLGFWLPGIGTLLSLLGTAGGVVWFVLMGTDLLRLARGAKTSQE